MASAGFLLSEAELARRIQALVPDAGGAQREDAGATAAMANGDAAMVMAASPDQNSARLLPHSHHASTTMHNTPSSANRGSSGEEAWSRTPHVSQRLFSRQHQQQQHPAPMEASPSAAVIVEAPPVTPISTSVRREDSSLVPSSRPALLDTSCLTGNSTGDTRAAHPFMTPQQPSSSSQRLAAVEPASRSHHHSSSSNGIMATSGSAVPLSSSSAEGAGTAAASGAVPSPLVIGGRGEGRHQQEQVLSSTGSTSVQGPALAARGVPAGDFSSAPLIRLRPHRTSSSNNNNHRSGGRQSPPAPQRVLPPTQVASRWGQAASLPILVGSSSDRVLGPTLASTPTLPQQPQPPPQQQSQVECDEDSSGISESEEEEEASSAIKETWLCPICLQTYDEPCTITLCNHNFCRSCLNSLVRAAIPPPQPGQRNDSSAATPGPVHCPLCRVEFSHEGHVACNRALQAEMQAALVRCPNKGCHLSYTPLLSKKHQDECKYSTACCPHRPHGCLFKAQRKDMAAHLRICPYEQIKGFFPKLRACLDQTSAAMRGWENGFISQQQMLATHTALLRNLDRKSHHNPLDHFKLATIVFWHPYLWPFEAERWARSFSFPVAAMVFYLLPIALAMVSVATRRGPPSPSSSSYGVEWTLFHAGGQQVEPYPYPIIGLGCVDNKGCILGISPKVSWVFLLLLLVTSYVEAYDNSHWLGTFRLWTPPVLSQPPSPSSSPTASASPSPSPSSAAASRPPTTPTTAGPAPDSSTTAGSHPATHSSSSSSDAVPEAYLQLTRYVLCTCVAWSSFALGSGPGAPVLYLSLACMLPVAFAMQLVARVCCKFQRPVIRGLIFGVMLRCFKWQDVAGSWVLTALLCRGVTGLYTAGAANGGLVTHILSKLPVKLESLGPLTVWGTNSPGSRLLSPVFLALSAALLYHLDGLCIVKCLGLQLALEALSVTTLFGIEKLLTRAMRAPRPGTAVPPERQADVLCVLYTRGILLLAVFSATVMILL